MAPSASPIWTRGRWPVRPGRRGRRCACRGRAGVRACARCAGEAGRRLADMPEREDRFSDLGRDERSRAERIGDQLAERDRTHPEPDQSPPEVPRPGNRYAWLVGILMLMGVSVLLITTALPNKGEGLFSLEPGKRLP